MTDIRTQMFNLGNGVPPSFDFMLDEPSLASDSGLGTAVMMSLFTDRLANDDDVIPDGTDNRRGWWADAFPQVDDDRIGSRLWLLHREKDTQQVVNRARDYATEALQWLIDENIVSRVDVRAGWVDKISKAITDTKTTQSINGVLGLEIIIYRNNEAPLKYQFNEFWSAN